MCFSALKTYATCFCLCLALSACSNNSKAPVKSLASEKPKKAAVAYNQYTVLKGDTLYSIAFRFGLNYRNLASNNQIVAPYRISPGQVVVLNDDFIPYQEVVTPRSEPAVTEVKPKPSTGAVTKPNTPVVKNPQTKPAIKPAQKPTIKPQKTPAKRPVVSSRYDNKRQVNDWYWPIKTSRKYSRTSKNQFIFKVPAGTDVRAVAAGRVVYSGKGLIGYGHLVIIKHSDTLLSAYAYNETVLVKEKQDIKAGQKISTVGKSPTGAIGLGFEIRLRGKPIDARKYLPK